MGIRRIAVVGMGTMGNQIGVICAKEQQRFEDSRPALSSTRFTCPAPCL